MLELVQWLNAMINQTIKQVQVIIAKSVNGAIFCKNLSVHYVTTMQMTSLDLMRLVNASTQHVMKINTLLITNVKLVEVFVINASIHRLV